MNTFNKICRMKIVLKLYFAAKLVNKARFIYPIKLINNLARQVDRRLYTKVLLRWTKFDKTQYFILSGVASRLFLHNSLNGTNFKQWRGVMLFVQISLSIGVNEFFIHPISVLEISFYIKGGLIYFFSVKIYLNNVI